MLAGGGGGGGIGSHHGSVPGPAAPRTVGPGGSGGGGYLRQGHTFVVLQRAVVGACGGLCVPGAPGPSSGAWVPYHVAAEGVYGWGDRHLPPARNWTPKGCTGRVV